MSTDSDLRYATAEADRTRESRKPRPLRWEQSMPVDPLAQSLVDAAKDAYPVQRWAPDPQNSNARETVGDLLRSNADERARVVAEAVLRELAKAERTFGVGSLLDLADAIRESPCP